MKNEILWSDFLQGDKAALSAIFNMYFDELYEYGLKISRHPEVIEDSMQDLFYRLWKNRSALGEVIYVRAYLYKALRRHIIHNLDIRNKLVNYEDPPEGLFDIEFSAEDMLINEQVTHESRKKLIAALNTLTKRQKEAIYLRYFKDLEFKTIADIMAMDVQSVRNSIQRGLASLRTRDLLSMFLFMLSYRDQKEKRL